ncbi:MAG: hypothetical protein L6R41_006064 [Letrouitia leprolyta]|nr:MAG: hypothetical protein L6R41_006064 [Letrouitia leprolyta]
MFKERYGSIAPTESRFEELKQHYRILRDNFRADPRSAVELEAWKRQDNDFNYELLNGNKKSFIPPGLVGKNSPGGTVWAATDTFFSVSNQPLSLIIPETPLSSSSPAKKKEYALHNPPSLILSESPHSYIIGNLASYDSRQYPSAPANKRPEGQGFAHTLVIPKSRIYNVVDPAAVAKSCFILKELRTHFINFWNHTPDGRAKILARTKMAMDSQDQKLLSDPESPETPIYESVRGDVFRQFEEQGGRFGELNVEEDFLFGFHVFPDNSIGHLHMHVFPHGEGLREWSTKEYDWKTVPLQAVLEVEREDAERGVGR